MTAKHFPVRSFDECPHAKHQQPPRRLQPSVRYAANAASSRNLGKAVVAVAAVLGSETAEVLVTPSLITRGTRASGYAKDDCSPG